MVAEFWQHEKPVAGLSSWSFRFFLYRRQSSATRGRAKGIMMSAVRAHAYL
jgi:hypothetical protein